jgi:hypothetical protein
VELAEVVAAAVRQRTPELERLVRERVDAELTRLVPELVERELAVRRNGGAPEPAPVESPSAATRRCTVCGLEQSLQVFREGRSVCRACCNRQNREPIQRRREREAPADEKPHPARKPKARVMGGGYLRSPKDDEDARAALAAATADAALAARSRTYVLTPNVCVKNDRAGLYRRADSPSVPGSNRRGRSES